MVFFGSLSHIGTPSRDGGAQTLDPGDLTGLRLGTVLAASPDTSLRLGLDVSRSGRTRLNGAKLVGSDVTLGGLDVGVL